MGYCLPVRSCAHAEHRVRVHITYIARPQVDVCECVWWTSLEGGGESVRARCADGREVRMAERRSEAPCGTSTRRDASGAMRVFSGALLSHGFHLCVAVGHFSFVRVCFGIGRHWFGTGRHWWALVCTC